MIEVTRKLVLTNKILINENVLDGLGHISVRHPSKDDIFLMLKAPIATSASEADVILIKTNGMVLGDPSDAVSERFIHSVIYSHRKDVSAICHAHNEYIVLLSAMGIPLRPLLHVASFISEGVAYLDIDDLGGFLINSQARGEKLASALGMGRIVVLKNHGYVLVARSLEELVALNVYLVKNARIQLWTVIADREVSFVSDGIAQKEKEDVLLNPRVLMRVWNYLVNKHS